MSRLQTGPQPPQFSVSVVMSTQAPPQSVRKGGQKGVHIPETQFPEPQALPTAPQLSGSVERSMQAPLTRSRPGRQRQSPETQNSVSWQRVPAGPQEFGSPMAGPPPQLPPAGQVHVPLVQVLPAPQPMLQPPQLRTSLAGETQAPPHTISPVPQLTLASLPGMEVSLRVPASDEAEPSTGS